LLPGWPLAPVSIASLLAIVLIVAALVAAPIAAASTPLPPADPAGDGETFVVSPTGDDRNPGTADQPWRTMHKVAAALRAGQTAVFEDGLYVETRASRFVTSGTPTAPITVMARHPHRATIRYQDLADRDKLIVLGARHVTIRDFEITQDTRGTTWGDKLVQCWDGADGCAVVGNWLHRAMEPLKTYDSDDVVFDGNTISDMVIGLGAFNTLGTIIRNNEIVSPESDGIQVKGGARGAQVYDNRIHTRNPMGAGILLGGSSCADCGIYDTTGYEAYASAAWNNLVSATTPGDLRVGLIIQGCDRCLVANNVVVGARTALATAKGPGREEGWLSDALVKDPTFVNNIVVACTDAAVAFEDVVSGLVHDFNLYHDCPEVPAEAHGIYDDPRFVDADADWRLQSDSPAIDAGTTPDFAGFEGETFDLSRDGLGSPRSAPWDLGAFESDG